MSVGKRRARRVLWAKVERWRDRRGGTGKERRGKGKKGVTDSFGSWAFRGTVYIRGQTSGDSIRDSSRGFRRERAVDQETGSGSVNAGLLGEEN